jgi:hypothetical protein
MPIGVRTSDLPPVAGSTDGAPFSGPPDVLLHPGGPAPPPALPDVLSLPPPPARPTRKRAEAGQARITNLVGAAKDDPHQALALDAVRLSRLLAIRSRHPARWQAPSFRREIDLVRAHLSPIRTRASLAASFGREAFHGRPPAGSARALAESAVRVAYAIRWLELGDGIDRPSWREWLRAAG